MPDPQRRDVPVRAPAARTTTAPAAASRGSSQVLVAPPAPSASLQTNQANPRASKPAKASRTAKARVSVPLLDVLVASGLLLVGAFATTLPVGPLRLVLVLPVLLFAPGFLLLQAFVVPAARGTKLLWQGLASLGLSPALVGLLALSTAIVQGGFKLGAILALVTLGGLGLAGTAIARRRAAARAAVSSSSPAAQASPAPTS